MGYYPFGMQHKSAGGNMVVSRKHNYGFGGFEKNYDFGNDVSTLDFGARLYDPAIGRWFVIDPLADQMRRHSPYNYAFDNPEFFIDPDGMMPLGGGGSGDRTRRRNQDRARRSSRKFSFGKSRSSRGRRKTSGTVGSAVSLEGSPGKSNLLNAATVESANPDSDLMIKNAGTILDAMGRITRMKPGGANGDGKTDASSDPQTRGEFNKMGKVRGRPAKTGLGSATGENSADGTVNNATTEEPKEEMTTMSVTNVVRVDVKSKNGVVTATTVTSTKDSTVRKVDSARVAIQKQQNIRNEKKREIKRFKNR